MLSRSTIKSNHLVLWSIILLASLLRIIFLSRIPSGFEHDEAVHGYDAYSILLTQRDEYGNFIPLFLKATGDYRSSIYSLMAVPLIKFLGLNEFATRLPAALAGILTVLIVYYLVKELFNNQQLAAVSALLLAISPWHVLHSRLAFQGIYFPLLFCLGLLFFVKSFQKANYLILSSLVLGLSLWTYYPARGFVPLFLLGLTLIFRQHLWRIRGRTVIAVAVFLSIFIFLSSFWFSPAGMARAQSVGLTRDVRVLIYQYFTYLSPIFLFFEGDRELKIIPLIGNLYRFELITVTAGIFFLLKGNQEQDLEDQRKIPSILIWWLISYPFPSAIASQALITRGVIGVPLYAILSAYGISRAAKLFAARKRRYFLFCTTVIVTTSFLLFSSYFFLNYSDYGYRKGSGIKEAIIYTEKSEYNCVSIRSEFFYRINYYLAFYTKFSPSAYQLSPIEPSLKEYTIGKYRVESKQRKELDDQCVQLIRPYETKIIEDKGYDWNEIHTFKHHSGVETVKLVKIKKRT